jgi:hypothetical protein
VPGVPSQAAVGGSYSGDAREGGSYAASGSYLPTEEPLVGDINAELASLKSRIDAMRVLYIVLFFGSMAVLLIQHAGSVSGLTLPWALLLGGAVATRLARQSMVNKYNALLAGGKPAPLQ